MAEIVREVQMAQLELVRNAYLTAESLEHTQLRPTAWLAAAGGPDRRMVCGHGGGNPSAAETAGVKGNFQTNMLQ